jgi:hypothetical protein
MNQSNLAESRPLPKFRSLSNCELRLGFLLSEIRTVEAMRVEGEAYTLTDEEITMIESFRRFKLRMRKDGEVFSFQTRKPEGVQIVEETAEIIHPNEALELTYSCI